MYCVKLDYFINAKYERPEIFVTEKQCESLVELRNDPETADKLVTVEGSGIWFSPKQILSITELDEESSWWKNNAPDYYFENAQKE